MSQGLGPAFDRAQRRYDNMSPPEDDPRRICERCRQEYNQDDQELDPPRGKDWCDECVQKHEDEQGPQA